MLTYHYKTPDEITEIEFCQLVELIYLGGKNRREVILPKLKSSKEIAFAKFNNEIISTTSIKRPTLEIRRSIFEKANSNEEAIEYTLESGFWSTKDIFQNNGLFRNLLHSQLSKITVEKIFSVVHDENAIDFLINDYSFKVSGSPFISEITNTKYSLLIR